MTEPAGIWLRVSSGAQDEANQEPDVTGYCAEHDYQIARTYAVHGKSAYKGKHQKALDEALADMRAGIIRVLVVWASDRIERRGAESVFGLVRRVREAGGRIEYVKDAYLNDANDMSDVMLALAATRDKQESKRKSERVGIAHDRIRDAGALGAGGIPWGYEAAGEKYHRQLVPSPEGRKYIPEIYARVIAGESLATVAAWLSKQTGLTWWRYTVGRLVRNPVYRGHRCELVKVTDPATGKVRKEHGRVLHRCEALVDAAVWRQANEALSHRPKRGPDAAADRAMLAGAIYCPRCENSPMYRITAGRATCRTAYYRCSGRGPDRQGCGNMVRCELADAAMSKIAASRFWALKETERARIAGHHYEAELAELDYELRQLPLRTDLGNGEMVAELQRLLSERDRLQSLPAVPDRWEVTETGRSYAQLWEALDPAERGPWLKAQGFRVTADRDSLTLAQDDPAGGIPFTATREIERRAAS